MISKKPTSNLLDTWKQVPDFRNAHGRSHPLWILLLLMVYRVSTVFV